MMTDRYKKSQKNRNNVGLREDQANCGVEKKQNGGFFGSLEQHSSVLSWRIM